MRNETKPFAFVALCLAAVLLVQAAPFEQNDSNRGPSDAIRDGNTSMGMEFVLRQLHDLRTVYCDIDVIADREERNVCFLDSKLGAWHQELSLSTNATLNSVLASQGFDWDGGRQIRIIQRNAIVQSDYPRPIGSTGWRDFLNIRIHPADVIILCPRER
jgi:hypothetical protein